MPRGRPKKYKTEEERLEAKRACDLRSYHKNKEKNKEKKNARQRRWSANNPDYDSKSSAKYRKGKRETLPSVIYQIFCKPTNTFYIGQTSTWAEARWTQHKSSLKNETHHVPRLLADYNEHGLEALEFSVLKELDPKAPTEELLTEENNYIKKFLNEGKKLYNKEGIIL